MKSGFGHFDDSHGENFCAAVLLLAMEVEDAVRALVAGAVCRALGVDEEPIELLSFGREARLATPDDEEGYARVDIWLLFRGPSGDFYAFVEVKTQDRWDSQHVADQVVRSGHAIRGSVLLAPDRICDRVRRIRTIPTIPWSTLLGEIRRSTPDTRL